MSKKAPTQQEYQQEYNNNNNNNKECIMPKYTLYTILYTTLYNISYYIHSPPYNHKKYTLSIHQVFTILGGIL